MCGWVAGWLCGCVGVPLNSAPPSPVPEGEKLQRLSKNEVVLLFDVSRL